MTLQSFYFRTVKFIVGYTELSFSKISVKFSTSEIRKRPSTFIFQKQIFEPKNKIISHSNDCITISSILMEVEDPIAVMLICLNAFL